MAVAENAGVKVDSSGQNLDNNTASATETKPPCPDDDDQSPKSDSSPDSSNPPTIDSTPETDDRINETAQRGQTLNGFNRNGFESKSENGERDNNGGSLKNEIKDLADAFSKLNPMAQEFVPPSLARSQSGVLRNGLGFTNNFAAKPVLADGNDNFARRVYYSSSSFKTFSLNYDLCVFVLFSGWIKKFVFCYVTMDTVLVVHLMSGC